MKTILLFVALSSLLFSASCSHGHGHKKGEHKGQHWVEMDADKDGAISKEEFDKFHVEKFKAMDTNNDGKISEDERNAFKSEGKMCSKKSCKKCGNKKSAE
ncbi:MAG: hypothetical protein COT74_09715 [Bdellovibrionales bacterium CG10_big_fil_rev_8_21_14_0_10_45_34]|nr:MAG: hypothetical protein COT74_09715 [Bdellovibrionales bacterium CG10_big_fil_rev_8_21_14_0_10_45_34]